MKAIIIDDEAVAAAAMKRRIKWDKYGIEEVLSAESMRQAIQIMENQAMDLMLCDVEMPGGSGLDLYEWVRTYSPDTECIFVSCHPEYEYVRKALTMGSMDYVLKPVDYEEMDRILTEAARRIRNRKDTSPKSTSGTTSGSASGTTTGSASGTTTGSASGTMSITDIQNPAKQSDTPDINIQSHNMFQNDLETEINLAGPQVEEQEAKPLSEGLRSEAVTTAVAYIQTHLDQNMSIRDISEVAHLNPQYFMRVFKKEMGKPVLEFITECRLNKAKELLVQTSLPITEVALTAGYDNFSYFSKLFKRYEGTTPSDYRKQGRNV